MSKKPFISIILVNYNGRSLLPNCLNSIFLTKYPKSKYEVILVDNNSIDDSVAYVSKHHPQVKLITLDRNSGFTGGNIEGFKHAKGEYIVMLNTDTRVDPSWLAQMVKTAQVKKVGIVSPKLLYDTPFLELTIKSKSVPRSAIAETIDFNPVGVVVENIECRTEKLSNQVWYKSGFYQKSNGIITARWSNGESKVLIPFVGKKEEKYSFKIHGYPSTEKLTTPVSIYLDNQKIYSTTLRSNQVIEKDLVISRKKAQKHFRWLVQNAGNAILFNGYSKDRGNAVRIPLKEHQLEFYEEDSQYYDQPTKLLAMCGGCALIKREVINGVGFLDDRYFMYYEDVDFSLRAWKGGWDIVYQPQAIVYHQHKATTNTIPSSFFVEMVEKNHISFVLTHFPLLIGLSELFKFIGRLIMSGVRKTVYQLRQDAWSYNNWHNIFVGRRGAFKSILANLVTDLKNHFYWKKNSQRSYLEMEKYLY